MQYVGSERKEEGKHQEESDGDSKKKDRNTYRR